MSLEIHLLQKINELELDFEELSNSTDEADKRMWFYTDGQLQAYKDILKRIKAAN